MEPLACFTTFLVLKESSLEGLHSIACKELLKGLEYRTESHVCVVKEAITRVNRSIAVDSDELITTPKMCTLSERATQKDVNNASQISNFESWIIDPQPDLEDLEKKIDIPLRRNALLEPRCVFARILDAEELNTLEVLAKKVVDDLLGTGDIPSSDATTYTVEDSTPFEERDTTEDLFVGRSSSTSQTQNVMDCRRGVEAYSDCETVLSKKCRPRIGDCRSVRLDEVCDFLTLILPGLLERNDVFEEAFPRKERLSAMPDEFTLLLLLTEEVDRRPERVLIHHEMCRTVWFE